MTLCKGKEGYFTDDKIDEVCRLGYHNRSILGFGAIRMSSKSWSGLKPK